MKKEVKVSTNSRVDWTKMNELDPVKSTKETDQFKLIKVSKKTLLYDQIPQSRTVKISFGKNGHGLTTEFSEISKVIEEESKNGEVFLEEAFLDPLDDVYDLTFKVIFSN